MSKYILWDNDGVLVDTESLFYLATKRAFSEMNTELPKSRYLQSMIDGKSCWTDLPAEVRNTYSIPDKRAARDRYYQEYIAMSNIDIPGALETVEQLSHSREMAVVTSSRLGDFQKIHEHRELLSYMSFSLTREDYEEGKPHPEPYLLALQKFGIEPNEAVAVEDSQRGLASALSAGIRCIIIENEFNQNQDFTGAAEVLPSITMLPTVLDA